jgi:hypothetical protein
MAIEDKVKLVVVRRDSPDVETVLGTFPTKDAALPAFSAESGATRTPIPVQGGQHSGDCGQRVMMA